MVRSIWMLLSLCMAHSIWMLLLPCMVRSIWMLPSLYLALLTICYYYFDKINRSSTLLLSLHMARSNIMLQSGYLNLYVFHCRQKYFFTIQRIKIPNMFFTIFKLLTCNIDGNLTILMYSKNLSLILSFGFCQNTHSFRLFFLSVGTSVPTRADFIRMVVVSYAKGSKYGLS